MEAKIGEVSFSLTWTGEIMDLSPPTRARALKFIDAFKALGNAEPEKRKPGRPSGSRDGLPAGPRAGVGPARDARKTRERGGRRVKTI